MNKWTPFNSIINGNVLTNEILKEKNKINKPILSDEQMKTFENLIFESYVNKTKLELTLYQNGIIYTKQGIVTEIKDNQKIILNKQKSIYFCEIIKVKATDF